MSPLILAKIKSLGTRRERKLSYKDSLPTTFSFYHIMKENKTNYIQCGAGLWQPILTPQRLLEASLAANLQSSKASRLAHCGVCEPAALASCGSLLETQVLGPTSDLLPAKLQFCEILRWAKGPLSCEELGSRCCWT